MKKLIIIFIFVFSIITINQCYALALVNDINDVDYQLSQLIQEEEIDIEKELLELKGTYQNDFNLEQSLEEKEKIKQLIEGLDIIIDEYTSSQNSIQTYANGQTNMAIATVIAYFNNKNYALANELLIHSTLNTDKKSTYEPTHKNIVRNTAVFKKIANGTSTSGSTTFVKGNTSESDCYYALHKVKYKKSSSTSKKVEITDYYDYASSNYSGLEGIAVDAMYRSQQNGYITPFTVTFSATL